VLRELLHKYQSIEMLLQMGEYQTGSDAMADHAIQTRDDVRRFLRQHTEDSSPLAKTLADLAQIAEGI